ncbi:Sjogren's syndrome/scleroderma autoantigen 1 (Autoantigen p27) family protein [Cryptosporidium felis]|nr:Sjogren's syndrome/scleroderma autoantigen 1 (Autoantigen p27) family protein [Cryptosporidium felis]
MKDVSAISGLMGSYLLKGWIMLGDACPSCEEVPLLEDPSNGIRYCMKCSPPVTPGRSPGIQSKVKEPTCNEAKSSNSTPHKGNSKKSSEESEIMGRSELFEHIHCMALETAKIGVSTLQNADLTIEERYVGRAY